MVSELAGTLTKQKIDVVSLKEQFFHPNGTPVPVKFGTSGHRGSLGTGFCAQHARAIAQAVARIHKERNITGPVLVGGDTRLMSADTARLCAEVLTGNGLTVILPDMPLPTPVFSFEIINGRACASLNGTASHNPPQDMGLKYNPSNGGPADAALTSLIEKYGLKNVEIVSKVQDPTFYFIPIDHDGKIRMDPSSKYPMSPLIKFVQDGTYDFAGASDPDADRFGCATKKGGLIPPNHALCVMADYLYRHHKVRDAYSVGRTLGTTSLLDRIALSHGLRLDEVNVGFKYFVEGIVNRKYVLAGEESAGMSVSGWTPEKDGIFAVCLLMEIMATEGDIADLYDKLTATHGTPYYTRVDVPTDEETKKRVKSLKAADFENLHQVAGEKVTRVRDTDGIKIYLQSSWFLVRPSGTENILKIYAETFVSQKHLDNLIEQAKQILAK